MPWTYIYKNMERLTEPHTEIHLLPNKNSVIIVSLPFFCTYDFLMPVWFNHGAKLILFSELVPILFPSPRTKKSDLNIFLKYLNNFSTKPERSERFNPPPFLK